MHAVGTNFRPQATDQREGGTRTQIAPILGEGRENWTRATRSPSHARTPGLQCGTTDPVRADCCADAFPKGLLRRWAFILWRNTNIFQMKRLVKLASFPYAIGKLLEVNLFRLFCLLIRPCLCSVSRQRAGRQSTTCSTLRSGFQKLLLTRLISACFQVLPEVRQHSRGQAMSGESHPNPTNQPVWARTREGIDTDAGQAERCECERAISWLMKNRWKKIDRSWFSDCSHIVHFRFVHSLVFCISLLFIHIVFQIG